MSRRKQDAERRLRQAELDRSKLTAQLEEFADKVAQRDEQLAEQRARLEMLAGELDDSALDELRRRAPSQQQHQRQPPGELLELLRRLEFDLRTRKQLLVSPAVATGNAGTSSASQSSSCGADDSGISEPEVELPNNRQDGDEWRSLIESIKLLVEDLVSVNCVCRACGSQASNKTNQPIKLTSSRAKRVR